MANRSESKAQLTHIAAKKIVEAESTQRSLKTARLRELRLKKQAEADQANEEK